MIETLFIKNFILIDELELTLHKGFNILAGETGAGKSIIISAIDIVFGAKTSKEHIKTGAEKALLEINVHLNNDFPFELLTESGIDIEGNELIISREITQTSSRSRINGVLVTQDFIKQIREHLIDIHSQHKTYSYLQPKQHINLLDNFGDVEHKNLLKEYSKLYLEFINMSKMLDELKNSANASEQEIEFLKFQIKEIEEAQIEELDEDIKLDEELQVLANAETLKELTYSAYWGLNGDECNVLQGLSSIKNNLSKAVEYDKHLEATESELLDAFEVLKDIASTLRNYSESVSLDEERLVFVQQRIDILNKIKRKYGTSLEEVLNKYNDFSDKLNSIEFSQDDIEKLEINLAKIEKKLKDIAEKISDSRMGLAMDLSVLLTKELEKLELPKVRFKVSVDDLPDNKFNENGKNNVEFLISTNISEDLKPLAKIASGGEISRVMLALKTIFAHADNINTVIFDEIDTGISGKASQAVGEEIVELAKTHQVLCITHQPMIAAKSNKYFYVKKQQSDKTKVNVFDLKDEDKIKALALMASGELSEDALNFARQLMRI